MCIQFQLCSLQRANGPVTEWQLLHACMSTAVQVLTNAGQANAATGTQGYEDAVNCATIAAASLGVSPDDVLLMSTGEHCGSQEFAAVLLLDLHAHKDACVCA